MPRTETENLALWEAAEERGAKPISWCRETLLRATKRTKANEKRRAGESNPAR
jgi:hypothetical protein